MAILNKINQSSSQKKKRFNIRYILAEIFLITAGILIALAIDNWNTDREEQKMIEKYLIEMYKEYSNEIERMEKRKIDLNLELDKNEQTSDWSRNKLTKKQIQYAINDIIYLSKIKKEMEIKLSDLKRLKSFNSIMKFMETRVELDLMGWENIDIFAHK